MNKFDIVVSIMSFMMSWMTSFIILLLIAMNWIVNIQHVRSNDSGGMYDDLHLHQNHTFGGGFAIFLGVMVSISLCASIVNHHNNTVNALQSGAMYFILFFAYLLGSWQEGRSQKVTGKYSTLIRDILCALLISIAINAVHLAVVWDALMFYFSGTYQCDGSISGMAGSSVNFNAEQCAMQANWIYGLINKGVIVNAILIITLYASTAAAFVCIRIAGLFILLHYVSAGGMLFLHMAMLGTVLAVTAFSCIKYPLTIQRSGINMLVTLMAITAGGHAQHQYVAMIFVITIWAFVASLSLCNFLARSSSSMVDINPFKSEYLNIGSAHVQCFLFAILLMVTLLSFAN